jgi:hypothetical protein
MKSAKRKEKKLDKLNERARRDVLTMKKSGKNKRGKLQKRLRDNDARRAKLHE